LCCFIAACLAFEAAPRNSTAAETTVRIESVQVGLNGLVKAGRWTPIRISVTGPAGQSVAPAVVALDPDGSPTSWSLPEITLQESGPQHVEGLFQVGRITGSLRVEAADAAQIIPIAGEGTALPETACRVDRQSVTFVCILGGDPGFAETFGQPAPDSRGATIARVIEFQDASLLPPTAEGLDALDLLVISGDVRIDAARGTAIDHWIRSGGHVVLAPGGAPEAYRSSPLAGWAPITVGDESNYSNLDAIVDRVVGAPPLAAGRGAKGVRIEVRDGVVLARDPVRGPLIVRSAHGRGRVTAFALDWTQPPISGWQGLPGLCRYLAEMDMTRGGAQAALGSELRPTGVSELATQLTGQLDQFPSVQRPSYWVVILLAAAFLLLIGPLDFLLVQRVLKRPRLTWLTLPIWTAVAAVGGNVVADQMNSAGVHANQVTLVDVDAASGLLRAQSWLTIYSPWPHRYQLAATAEPWFEPASGESSGFATLCWYGTPEPGFRGMYRPGGLDFANPAYSVGVDRSEIENLPIGQASTKVVTAEWSGDAVSAEAVSALLESDLSESDDGSRRLEGSLTHFLPGDLTDYLLAYGNYVYVPRPALSGDQAPSIPPSLAWRPADLQPRILDRYLKGIKFRYVQGQTLKGQEAIPEQQDYDPLGYDPLAWARVLTFHDVTGGEQYTTLTNSALQSWDLSRLLTLHRAVLFGRIQPQAISFSVDGAEAAPERRSTFVRLILPVKPAEAN
jgi:hypothetical protein